MPMWSTVWPFKIEKEYVVRNTVFLQVIPCSPVEVRCHFREMYCLHFQHQGVSQANNKQETCLTLKILRWSSTFLWIVTEQQITRHHIPEDGAFFIVVTVRSSNPINSIKYEVLKSGDYADYWFLGCSSVQSNRHVPDISIFRVEE
jgi:hypothetical protein